MASDLRNRSNMKNVVSSALSYVVPDVVQSPEDHSNMSERYRLDLNSFRLDMAFMLVRRRETAGRSLVRWGWADSSEQGGNDFMSQKHRWCWTEDIVAVARAVNRLSQSSHAMILQQRSTMDDSSEGDLSSGDDDVDIPLINRSELTRFVHERVHEHVYAPASLGYGQTGLVHKVAVCSHQSSIESMSFKEWASNDLDSFRSMTTDLGTEVKTTEFRVSQTGLRDLLPSWAIREPRIIRAETFDDEEVPAADHIHPWSSPSAPEVVRHFMEFALITPGGLHLLHTCAQDMCNALSHFAVFFAQLQVMERLLSRKKRRRQRLVATCVSNSEHSRWANQVLAFTYRLYTKRWNNIIGFCHALIGIIGILKQVWNEDRFASSSDADGDDDDDPDDADDNGNFDPHEVTKVLRDLLFSGYLRMIVKVGIIPRNLGSFIESCCCHAHIFKSHGDRVSKRTKKLGDGLKGPCINCGCRGAELVGGSLRRRQKRMKKSCLQDLRIELETRVPPADLVVIFRDYELATSHLDMQLSIKFAWLWQLPWMLIGMAHWCVRVACRIARRCLEAFDSIGINEHHRLSIRFLAPGTVLRGEVQVLADSGIVVEGSDLERELAILRGIPFAERTIEAEHVFLHMAGDANVEAGWRFSLEHRLTFIKERLKSDNEFKQCLLDDFARLTTAKGAISAMGFERHPELMCYMDPKDPAASRKPAWPVLSRAVYRQDLLSQYEDWSMAAAVNTAAEKANAKQVAEKKPSTRCLTVEDVLCVNFFDHVKSTGASYSTLSCTASGNVLPFPIKSIEALLHSEDAASQLDSLAVEPVRVGGEPVFFKVLANGAGRMKTIANFIRHKSSKKLAQNSMVVTLHSGYMDAEGQPVVAMSASSNVQGVSRYQVVTSFDSCDWNAIQSLTGWQGAEHLSYMFDAAISSIDFTANSTVAMQLIEASAMPDTDVWLPLQSERLQNWVDTVHALADTGHVVLAKQDQDQDCVQISKRGMGKVRLMTPQRCPHPLAEPRALALADLSRYELMVLVHREFQWCLLPTQLAAAGSYVQHHGQGLAKTLVLTSFRFGSAIVLAVLAPSRSLARGTSTCRPSLSSERRRAVRRHVEG